MLPRHRHRGEDDDALPEAALPPGVRRGRGGGRGEAVLDFGSVPQSKRRSGSWRIGKNSRRGERRKEREGRRRQLSAADPLRPPGGHGVEAPPRRRRRAALGQRGGAPGEERGPAVGRLPEARGGRVGPGRLRVQHKLPPAAALLLLLLFFLLPRIGQQRQQQEQQARKD